MTTVRTRLITTVAAAAAVLIAALWYFAVWSPQAHQLATAHKNHAAAEAKAGQLNDQVAVLQGLLRDVPADTARLAAARAAVPDNPSLDSALRELHDSATATGVTVSQVVPSVPAGSATMGGSTQGSSQGSSAANGAGAVPTVTLKVTLVGTQAQIESFVSRLVNLRSTHRVFVVDDLSLSGSGNLSAELSVRVFYAGQPTP